MKNRVVCALLVALSLLSSCNRDPEAAKKRYVENGNKYYDKGKYKEALIMYRNALKRDLKYGEAYYRSALAELKLQRFVDAARNLQRAVELQPKNLDAHNRLANLYLNVFMADRKRPKHLMAELKSISEKFSKRFPESYEDAKLKGFIALFERDVPGSLVEFEKANKLKPYQPDLVLVYMQTLAANKQQEEAEKLGYEMLAKDPTALPVYDALVLMYARQNRVADVERILKSKVEKNPGSVQAHLQLAAHYFTVQQREPMMAALRTVSSNEKDFPNGLLQVGDFFLRTREFDLAAQHYQQGIDRTPKEKATYQKRLIEVLVKQNKNHEAVRLVDEILKADPKDNEAIAIRASLSLLTGTKEQLQAAINDLQTVISRTPENPVPRYNLGRALLAKQNPQAARVQFEEAVKLRPDYLPPRIALAQMMVQNREFGKASQMAQEILAYDPNNVPARLLRSRALIAMGETAQARNELSGTAKQFPDLPEARLQMAALDLQEKNFKDAEDSFRKLYQQSSDPRAFMGLVDTHVNQGQHAQAVKLLRDELSKHPDRLEYRVALGNIGLMTKDYKMAIAEFKTVLDKNPRNSQIWVQLSEAYRRTGEVSEAIAATRKAQEVAPTNVAANLQLALLYDTSGQRSQARPVYEEVLKTQPDNAIALNNLAYLLAESGTDLDQALTMAERARRALPNDVDVADTLGWIYIKKNLPESAIPIFKELIAKQPGRSTFHYHLGMALYQKGDKIAAKHALESALQQKPARDEESRIRELMAKIG
jgi:tetratricopeptide (TPR) repeat protein